MLSPVMAQLMYDVAVLLNEVSDVILDSEDCDHLLHAGVHDMPNDDLYDLVSGWRERAQELKSRET